MRSINSLPSCPPVPQKETSLFNPAEFDPHYRIDPETGMSPACRDGIIRKAKQAVQNTYNNSGYQNNPDDPQSEALHTLWQETVWDAMNQLVNETR